MQITAILNNLPYSIAVATAVAVALGTIGALTGKLGVYLASTDYTALRGVGHVLILVGGLLVGIYSHWGQVIAAVKQFAAIVSTLLPKGPSGGGGAGDAESGAAHGGVAHRSSRPLAFVAVACLALTDCGLTGQQIGKDVLGVVQVVGRASQYLSDGGNWLGYVDGLLGGLPDAVGKSEAMALVEQGRAELLDIGKRTSGIPDLTPQEIDDAYKDFRATVAIIAQIASQLGLPASSGAMKSHVAGAPQPAPVPLPLPLCVTNFKGSAQ